MPAGCTLPSDALASSAAMLAAYGATDLLCYRAEGPLELVVRQAEAWDPLLSRTVDFERIVCSAIHTISLEGSQSSIPPRQP